MAPQGFPGSSVLAAAVLVGGAVTSPLVDPGEYKRGDGTGSPKLPSLAPQGFGTPPLSHRGVQGGPGLLVFIFFGCISNRALCSTPIFQTPVPPLLLATLETSGDSFLPLLCKFPLISGPMDSCKLVEDFRFFSCTPQVHNKSGLERHPPPKCGLLKKMGLQAYTFPVPTPPFPRVQVGLHKWNLLWSRAGSHRLQWEDAVSPPQMMNSEQECT